MENNTQNQNGFSYTYSAKEQEELKRILDKYTATTESEDRMERLRKLDAGVTRTARAVAIVFGIVGTLILGLGMSLCMSDFAEILGTYQYITTPTTQHPDGLLLTSTVYSRMRGDESVTCTVLGGKTGYTIPAGQCLATFAKNKTTNTNYVCVTAGGETKWRPVYDSIYLYQYYTADEIPLTPPPSNLPAE